MTDTPFTPLHLRESVFRTYEPFLRLAVRNWPNETSFTIPPETAPTTFIARFRDAVLSLKKFSWPTDVDMKKLWSITGQYCINQDTQGVCWFRHKQPRGRPLELRAEAREHAVEASAPASPVPWRDSTEDELKALCLLIGNARLTGPILLDARVDPTLVAHLLETYNVGIVYDETTKQTIIT